LAAQREELVVIESLRIQLVDPSRLVMSGTVNTPTAQAELRRYLSQLHGQIERSRVGTFIVDIRGLDFVNSSAIRVFVDWISGAQAANYKIVFWIDRSVTWHRLSFSVLKSLAPRAVEVIDRPSGQNVKLGVSRP
jgi:hypothetical protein